MPKLVGVTLIPSHKDRAVIEFSYLPKDPNSQAPVPTRRRLMSRVDAEQVFHLAKRRIRRNFAHVEGR